MKILSVRRGFLADHSSTSYEFMAVDQPLDKRARAAVAKLSSRVSPTERHASFVYNAEGYDIPGGWQKLMASYYDVMCRESYGWCTLACAFETADPKLVALLKRYVFEDEDALGVRVTSKPKGKLQRVVVAIEGRMEDGYCPEDEDGDDWDEDEEEAGGEARGLLGLAGRIRACLVKSDMQPLWAVWKAYGGEDDEAPPKPKAGKPGSGVAKELTDLLGQV